MYICPTCKKEFLTEEKIVKHSLSCWRKANPNHQSKNAPIGAPIEHREINADVANFFNTFLERKI